MKRIVKDYTISIVEILHPNFGRGFQSEAYIAKDNGTKANIHVFGCYGCGIKSHKEMLEYTVKLLNL